MPQRAAVCPGLLIRICSLVDGPRQMPLYARASRLPSGLASPEIWVISSVTDRERSSPTAIYDHLRHSRTEHGLSEQALGFPRGLAQGGDRRTRHSRHPGLALRLPGAQQTAQLIQTSELGAFGDHEPVAVHGNHVVAARVGPAMYGQPAGLVETALVH
jgi:hypothetical protein